MLTVTEGKGSARLLTAVSVDLLIDGLVLGIGFSAGSCASLLLIIALTRDLLLLSLTVATELGLGERSWTAVSILLKRWRSYCP